MVSPLFRDLYPDPVPVDPEAPEEEREEQEEVDASLLGSFARGIDQSQAMLYALVNALGSATGIDFIAEWGQEGMDRNIKEMLKNPPTLERWDDVDSLADVGRYVLERVMEEVPSLGATLVAAGLGGAAGGAAAVAARTGARAGLSGAVRERALARFGKAVTRRVGPTAGAEARRRAGQALGGTIGAASFGFSENIGESRMNQLLEGSEEADAPVAALMTGVSKGLFDLYGFNRILRAVRGTGRSASDVIQEAEHRVRDVVGAAVTEGFTEGVQTAIDQISLGALTDTETFTPEHWDEIRESAIAGGTVGGVLSGGAYSFNKFNQYLERRQQMDSEADRLIREELQGRFNEERSRIAGEQEDFTGPPRPPNAPPEGPGGDPGPTFDDVPPPGPAPAPPVAPEDYPDLGPPPTEDSGPLDPQEGMPPGPGPGRPPRQSREERIAMIQAHRAAERANEAVRQQDAAEAQQREEAEMLRRREERVAEIQRRRAEREAAEATPEPTPAPTPEDEQAANRARLEATRQQRAAPTVPPAPTPAPNDEPDVVSAEEGATLPGDEGVRHRQMNYEEEIEKLDARVARAVADEDDADALRAQYEASKQDPASAAATEESYASAMQSLQDAYTGVVGTLNNRFREQQQVQQQAEADSDTYEQRMNEAGYDFDPDGQVMFEDRYLTPEEAAQAEQQAGVTRPEAWNPQYQRPGIPDDEEDVPPPPAPEPAPPPVQEAPPAELPVTDATFNPEVHLDAETYDSAREMLVQEADTMFARLRESGMPAYAATLEREFAQSVHSADLEARGMDGRTKPDADGPLSRPRRTLNEAARTLASDINFHDDIDYQTRVRAGGELDQAAMVSLREMLSTDTRPREDRPYAKNEIRKDLREGRGVPVTQVMNQLLTAMSDRHPLRPLAQRIADMGLEQKFVTVADMRRHPARSRFDVTQSRGSAHGQIEEGVVTADGVSINEAVVDPMLGGAEQSPADHAYADEYLVEALLHEPVHLFTYNASKSTKPEFKPYQDQLEDILKEAQKAAGKDHDFNPHFLKNRDELLAGGHTNYAFQKFLQSTPVSQQYLDKHGLGGRPISLWRAFINAISGFFGWTPSDQHNINLLDEVLRIGGEGAQNPPLPSGMQSTPAPATAPEPAPTDVPPPPPVDPEQEFIEGLPPPPEDPGDFMGFDEGGEVGGPAPAPEIDASELEQYYGEISEYEQHMETAEEEIEAAKMVGGLVIPENDKQLKAQFRALLDPRNGIDAIFVPTMGPQIYPQEIRTARKEAATFQARRRDLLRLANEVEKDEPEAAARYRDTAALYEAYADTRRLRTMLIHTTDALGASGTVVTNSDEKYAELERITNNVNGATPVDTQQLGQILFHRPEGKFASDGLMVSMLDEDGNPVRETNSHRQTLARDIAIATGRAGPGYEVRVSAAPEVLRGRVQGDDPAVLDHSNVDTAISTPELRQWLEGAYQQYDERVAEASDEQAQQVIDDGHSEDVDAVRAAELERTAIRSLIEQMPIFHLVNPRINRPEGGAEGRTVADLTEEERIRGTGFPTYEDAMNALVRLESDLPDNNRFRHIVPYRFSSGPNEGKVRYLIRETFLPPQLAVLPYMSASSVKQFFSPKSETWYNRLLPTPVEGAATEFYSTQVLALGAVAKAKDYGNWMERELTKLQDTYEDVIMDAFRASGAARDEPLQEMELIMASVMDAIDRMPHLNERQRRRLRDVYHSARVGIWEEGDMDTSPLTDSRIALFASDVGGLVLNVMAQRYVDPAIRQDYESRIARFRSALIYARPAEDRRSIAGYETSHPQIEAERRKREEEAAKRRAKQEAAGEIWDDYELPNGPNDVGPFGAWRVTKEGDMMLQPMSFPVIAHMGNTLAMQDQEAQIVSTTYETRVKGVMVGVANLSLLGYDLAVPGGPYIHDNQTLRPELLVKVGDLNNPLSATADVSWSRMAGNPTKEMTAQDFSNYVQAVVAYVDQLKAYYDNGAKGEEPLPPVPLFDPIITSEVSSSSPTARNDGWHELYKAEMKVRALDTSVERLIVESKNRPSDAVTSELAKERKLLGAAKKERRRASAYMRDNFPDDPRHKLFDSDYGQFHYLVTTETGIAAELQQHMAERAEVVQKITEIEDTIQASAQWEKMPDGGGPMLIVPQAPYKDGVWGQRKPGPFKNVEQNKSDADFRAAEIAKQESKVGPPNLSSEGKAALLKLNQIATQRGELIEQEERERSAADTKVEALRDERAKLQSDTALTKAKAKLATLTDQLDKVQNPSWGGVSSLERYRELTTEIEKTTREITRLEASYEPSIADLNRVIRDADAAIERIGTPKSPEQYDQLAVHTGRKRDAKALLEKKQAQVTELVGKIKKASKEQVEVHNKWDKDTRIKALDTEYAEASRAFAKATMSPEMRKAAEARAKAARDLEQYQKLYAKTVPPMRPGTNQRSLASVVKRLENLVAKREAHNADPNNQRKLPYSQYKSTMFLLSNLNYNRDRLTYLESQIGRLREEFDREEGGHRELSYDNPDDTETLNVREEAKVQTGVVYDNSGVPITYDAGNPKDAAGNRAKSSPTVLLLGEYPSTLADTLNGLMTEMGVPDTIRVMPAAQLNNIFETVNAAYARASAQGKTLAQNGDEVVMTWQTGQEDAAAHNQPVTFRAAHNFVAQVRALRRGMGNTQGSSSRQSPRVIPTPGLYGRGSEGFILAIPQSKTKATASTPQAPQKMVVVPPHLLREAQNRLAPIQQEGKLKEADQRNYPELTQGQFKQKLKELGFDGDAVPTINIVNVKQAQATRSGPYPLHTGGPYIYAGRVAGKKAGSWGNPFIARKGRLSVEQVVAKYRQYMIDRIMLNPAGMREELTKVHGKTVGYSNPPQGTHAIEIGIAAAAANAPALDTATTVDVNPVDTDTQAAFDQFVLASAQAMSYAFERHIRMLDRAQYARILRQFNEDKKLGVPVWNDPDVGFRAWLVDRLQKQVSDKMAEGTYQPQALINDLAYNPHLDQAGKLVFDTWEWLVGPPTGVGPNYRRPDKAKVFIPESVARFVERTSTKDLVEAMRVNGHAPTLTELQQRGLPIEEVPPGASNTDDMRWHLRPDELAKMNAPEWKPRRNPLLREARGDGSFTPENSDTHHRRLKHRLRNSVAKRLRFINPLPLKFYNIDANRGTTAVEEGMEGAAVEPLTVYLHAVRTVEDLHNLSWMPNMGDQINENTAAVVVDQFINDQGVLVEDAPPIVVIVTDNVQDVEEATAYVRHEILAHYGMSKFMMDHERAAFRRLIKASNTRFGVEDIFEEVAINYPDLDEDGQIDEVAGRIAEYMVVPESFGEHVQAAWLYMKDILLRFLRKLGFVDRDARSERELRSTFEVLANRLANRSLTHADDEFITTPMNQRVVPDKTVSQTLLHLFKGSAQMGKNVWGYNMAIVPDLMQFYRASTNNTRNNSLPLGQVNKSHDKIKNAFNSAPLVRPAKFAMSRGAILRALNPQLADMLMHRAQSQMKDTKSYQTGVNDSKRQWRGELFKLFRETGMDNNEALRSQVLYEMAIEKPYAEKSPEAQKLTDFLRRFGDYLEQHMHKLDLIDNYFPRNHIKEEYEQRYEEALEVFLRHRIKDPEDVLDTIIRFDYEYEKVSEIVDNPGYIRDRRIQNPALIKELVDRGFISPDPRATLLAYMEKTIKRAEMERVLGAMWPEKYAEMTPAQIAQFRAMTPEQIYEEEQRYWEEWNQMLDLSSQTGGTTAEGQAFIDRVREQGPTPFWGRGTWKADAEAEYIIMADPDPLARDELRKLVHGIVLNVPLDRNSRLYRILAEVKAYESLRVLLGSGLASIPEAGGIYTRAKGSIPARDMAKQVYKLMTDAEYRGSMTEMARLLGILREDLGAAMATDLTSAELNDTKTGFFGRMLPVMFQVNGNNFIVNMSRILAMSTGQDFIRTQAGKLHALDTYMRERTGEGIVDEETGRIRRDMGLNNKTWFEYQSALDWLGELGIKDWTVVVNWSLAGEPKWSHTESSEINDAALAVENAVNTFVNESVLNPTPGDRPLWFDSMWGQMVGHLKSFIYSYMSTVIGGFSRELSRRWDRGENISAQLQAWQYALPFVVSSVAVFAFLGALSEELRQRIFTLGERGGMDRANNDLGTYLENIAERAGFLQLPFFDALLHTDKGLGAITYQAGPAAHHFYETQQLLFGDNPDVKKAILNSIPVVSQLPTVRRDFYSAGEDIEYAATGS